MNNTTTTHHFDLQPADSRRIANLCGKFDEHLRQIEKYLSVTIHYRNYHFYITGDQQAITIATEVLRTLYQEAATEEDISAEKVHLLLQTHRQINSSPKQLPAETINLRTKRHNLKPRGINQQLYLHNIFHHDINFGIGPAGTGKTYLAVACAVTALEKEQIERILLVRPAVEAGEKLGFLPGDLTQKVDPYLRPLYDALYEMLGFEQVARLVERGVIEIAPLAYMRGRTLNNAFIILDESQNTTREQMKMFLTRIGFGATAVITGDITQTDLPKGKQSGLRHAMDVLAGVEGISFTYFNAGDVVRHPLVQAIVQAYDRHEQQQLAIATVNE